MSDADSPTIVLKDDGLKALKAAFKTIPHVHVGVLGKGARAGGKGNNAIILAAHEFGTATLPRRSILVVPLRANLNNYLKKAGAFNQATLARVIRERSIKPWVTLVGMTCLRIVDDAFETAGFGKWKPSKMARKKVKQTMVETGQLRRGMSMEVKE